MKQTFGAKTFRGYTLGCGTLAGTGVAQPTTEGLEYTVAKNRLHFVPQENRLHFVPQENRLHFTVHRD